MDPSGLNDAFNRTVNYMRISVTDRCNMRCLYCMPEEGVPWIPHGDILSYEEIAQATGVSLGTVKSRISRARARLRDLLLARGELLPDLFRPSSEGS